MKTQLFAKHARRLAPGLTLRQVERLLEYEQLLLHYNRTTNLVSTESARQFRLRHTLHSLCLARQQFSKGEVVADWGSGGGLPGIPLAICFPQVVFHLVDSSMKKQVIVQAISDRLDLDNVHVEWTRAEEFGGHIDRAVSRATAPLRTLWGWTTRVAGDSPELVCLKGGDLQPEIADLKDAFQTAIVETETLRERTGLDYFEAKYVVRVRRQAAKSDLSGVAEGEDG